ncbi:MAG: carbon monoxide dehydrogenase accessory protein CooC [Candidatus Dormibacteraceae bacterium]
MKVLITGKGGVGKTTIAAVLARSLARRGLNVIAIDGDANPNLGLALGIGEGIQHVHSVNNDIGKRIHEKELGELLETFGVSAPDGVRLLQTGEVAYPSEGCPGCGPHETLREVVARFPDDMQSVVIADLEPGVNDLIWAHPKPHDVVLIVTDTSKKSLEVGKNMRAVAAELNLGRVIVIANRAERPDDAERARAEFPGTAVHVVPEDPLVRQADRDGLSPIDTASNGPGVSAITALVDQYFSIGAPAT